VRALSILAVFAFHGVDFLGSLLGKNGWLGVDIFFVISGFLISRIAMAEIEKRGSLNVSRFFLGRILRITPAIWVMLSVYAIVNPHQSASNLEAVWLAVLNLTDYDVALGLKHSVDSGLGFCWSLAVEEKFYLLFPLIILLYRRFRTPWVLFGLLVVAEIWKCIQINHGADSLRLLGAFDTRFDEILIGCLAASLLDRKERFGALFKALGQPFASAALLFAILFYVRCFVLPDTLVTLSQKHIWWLVSMPLFAVLVGLLLLSLTISQQSGKPCLLSKVLSCSPLRFMGKLSYSLYLWHGLAFLLVYKLSLPHGWLPDLAKLSLAIVFAFISYSLIEKPFLTIKKHLSSSPDANALAEDGPSIASSSSLQGERQLTAVR
jgi:peptidoglycan/LPS O-acetylase OafA/YrhL